MGKKKTKFRDQLGIGSYFAVSAEQRLLINKKMLEHELGILPDFLGWLRQYLVEVIPNSPGIIRFHQSREKGYHLKGLSEGYIKSFLAEKLANANEKKMSNLVGYVNSILRKDYECYVRSHIIEMYREVERSDGPKDKKRDLLNRISDISTSHKLQDKNKEGMDYFDLFTEGKNLPGIFYYGGDKRIAVSFGTIEVETHDGTEFTRDLEGKIRNTYPYPSGNVNDPAVQEKLQERCADSIRLCEKNIAEERKKEYSVYNYSSKVFGGGEDGFAEGTPVDTYKKVEQLDNSVITSLKRKYGFRIDGTGDHVFFNFHGRTKAAKVVYLIPGFLTSFEDMHPREVAEQFCRYLEETYQKIIQKATSKPAKDAELEQRV